MVFTIKGYN